MVWTEVMGLTSCGLTKNTVKTGKQYLPEAMGGPPRPIFYTKEWILALFSLKPSYRPLQSSHSRVTSLASEHLQEGQVQTISPNVMQGRRSWLCA